MYQKVLVVFCVQNVLILTYKQSLFLNSLEYLLQKQKYRILTFEIQIPPAVYSSKAQNNALGTGGKIKTGRIPWTVSRHAHDSLLGHPKFIALLLARPTGLSNVAF